MSKSILVSVFNNAPHILEFDSHEEAVKAMEEEFRKAVPDINPLSYPNRWAVKFSKKEAMAYDYRDEDFLASWTVFDLK